MLWEVKDNKFSLINPKGPSVGLTKTIVMCLNHVVTSCVMNHWLPFDALTIAINLTMAMELSQIPLLMG